MLVINKFPDKDATCPDKALPTEVLELPWQFKEAMNIMRTTT